MEDFAKVARQLIEYPREASWFEFKENWFEPAALGEYISSLSNAAAMEGQRCGYLVWGVNDETHEVVGTTFDYHIDVKHEPLEHFLARQVTPDVGFSFHELELDGRRVVLLAVPAATKVPTGFNGMRYLRIGSSKVNLAKYPERESQLFYTLRMGPATVVNTPSDYQDLTFDKLLVYYTAKGVQLSRRTFKKNLRLLCEDGRYNLLAQLLSDDSHIPVRFAMFNGPDKTSTMYAVREFGNTCLLYSLDKALEYGELLNVPQADERDRVVERKEVMLFDESAFREAMVNAFVHNRWVSGNAPMITVFSDRIEILSRGTLPPEQTMEGFFAGESVPVNQELSDIFLQLHISERTGRGVPKVTGVYGRGTYEFRENSIVATIPFNRLERDVTGGVTGGFTPQELEGTPQESRPTLQVTPQEEQVTPQELFWRRKPNAVAELILRACVEPKSMKEISEALGYNDRKTVRRHVQLLLDEGRLAMTIPGSPTNRNQKYVTVR